MRSLLVSSVVFALAIPAVAWPDDTVPLGLTFTGQSGHSQTPQTTPDVGGGASDGALVEVVSGFVTIRDGTGHVRASSTADAFWTAAGITGTPNAFAQHAVFNASNQRWYLSAEQATAGTPNAIYLAVSASRDPTGPWKAVAMAPGSAQIANTHLAADACGVYLTGDTATGGVARRRIGGARARRHRDVRGLSTATMGSLRSTSVRTASARRRPANLTQSR
jgi:hypothetical protein